MSQQSRLTRELSHDFLQSPSSGVSVTMGTICSNQVVCQINSCFNTNSTGFLQEKNKLFFFNALILFLTLYFYNIVQKKKTHSTLDLAIIQVAESSNDLLLIQLICLQLHTPHGLHGAVVLQTLITSHNHLSGRGLIQLVDIAFLKRRKHS